MRIPTHCLAIGIASLAVLSCKDVTQTPQPSTQETEIKLDSAKAIADIIAESAYQHTKTILEFGHRQPESSGLRKSKDYVIAELKKNGWSCVEQKLTSSTPYGEIRYSNLIARYSPKPGGNPWNKPIKGVLAAHIDSKKLPNFLGADDAASCVATIVALSKHLHTNHPNAAKQLELVIFDGEEAIGSRLKYGYRVSPHQRDGLYGSEHYSQAVQSSVAHKVHPYKKTPEFGIVLDMIGHKDLRVKIPSDTPKKLAHSYLAARKKLGLKNHFGFAQHPISDDHVPMNTIARIPTIDIIGDFTRNGWWHTSDDSIDLISTESLSMSIQMTLEILSNQL